MTAPRYFRQGYHEELPLPSGSRMRLRIVGPGDRDGLLQAFENLSTESRIHRWLYPKRSLSEEEVRQLLSPENDDHVAMVAVEIDPEGNELSGIGMARFVRVPGDPEAGEIAITIVDEWQGLGIGRILLHRLLAAMSERGVAKAVGRMHVENLRMRRLLEPYLPEDGIFREDSTLVFEMPVPEHDDAVMAQLARNAAAVVRMFRLAAEGMLLQPLQAAERQLESLVPRAVLDQLQRKAGGSPGKSR